MEIVVVDSSDCSAARQQSIQLILTLPFAQPVDFVFDYANLRLALALDFDSHPQLVEYLQTLPHQHPVQAAGGRFGRTTSGHLATSEWSGRYGEAWNAQNRQTFTQFMTAVGIPVIHQAWHEHQTANQVG